MGAVQRLIEASGGLQGFWRQQRPRGSTRPTCVVEGFGGGLGGTPWVLPQFPGQHCKVKGSKGSL